ncbi:MAG: hypothetical protein Q9212_004074 [Teloschistes hypoglaucus]
MESPTLPADALADSRWLVSTNYWLTLNEMEPFFLQPYLRIDSDMLQKVIWLKHRFRGLENLTIDRVKDIQHQVARIGTSPTQNNLQPHLRVWRQLFLNWSLERTATAVETYDSTIETARKNERIIESMKIPDGQYIWVIVAQNYTTLSQQQIYAMFKLQRLWNNAPLVEFAEGTRDQMPSWIYSYAEQHKPQLHEKAEHITADQLRGWADQFRYWLNNAVKRAGREEEAVAEIPRRETPLRRNYPG